jgi:hypothetical protein
MKDMVGILVLGSVSFARPGCFKDILRSEVTK